MTNNLHGYVLRYNLTTQQAERWAACAQMPLADLPRGTRSLIERRLRQMGETLPEADVIAEALAEYLRRTTRQH